MFGPLEKLVLDLAVAMTRTPPAVGDELIAELKRHFTDAQIIELTTEIALANYRGRFNRALGCQAAGFSAGAFCPLPQEPG
ncbi:MAG TPA: hypothetical protein VI078_00810 [bacterium]